MSWLAFFFEWGIAVAYLLPNRLCQEERAIPLLAIALVFHVLILLLMILLPCKEICGCRCADDVIIGGIIASLILLGVCNIAFRYISVECSLECVDDGCRDVVRYWDLGIMLLDLWVGFGWPSTLMVALVVVYASCDIFKDWLKEDCILVIAL
jgi:hypothetical protein